MRPIIYGNGLVSFPDRGSMEATGDSADPEAVVEGYDWLVAMTSGHQADQICLSISSFDDLEWLLRTLGETIRNAGGEYEGDRSARTQ